MTSTPTPQAPPRNEYLLSVPIRHDHNAGLKVAGRRDNRTVASFVRDRLIAIMIEEGILDEDMNLVDAEAIELERKRTEHL